MLRPIVSSIVRLSVSKRMVLETHSDFYNSKAGAAH